MTDHLYKVSLNVSLADGAGVNLKPFATNKIIAKRPERGTEPRYRVKGDGEPLERLVGELQLTALEPPTLESS